MKDSSATVETEKCHMYLPAAVINQLIPPCTHYELADVLQAAEPQVGDVPLVPVPVLVSGVDVCDAGSSDQRNALITWTFSHKQHGGLVRVDVSSPKSIK